DRVGHSREVDEFSGPGSRRGVRRAGTSQLRTEDIAMANTSNSGRPSVVLVHGAFADASGWARVIPLLDAKGPFVTAVQNPLTSVADDVATTRRAIEASPGPVVLVGHSYGGAVITSAAAGNNKVKALVYIAAFGPDAGENLNSLLQR